MRKNLNKNNNCINKNMKITLTHDRHDILTKLENSPSK